MKDEREIIERLETEGARQRETDLSVKAINATRRRVAHILAEKREAKTERGMMIPWLKMAALIPIVLIGVLLMITNRDKTVQPTSSELAMQDEIEELSSSLRGGLLHFQGEYQTISQTSSFEMRSSRLKNRMDRCFIELQKEFIKDKLETVGNNNFMEFSPGGGTKPTPERNI